MYKVVDLFAGAGGLSLGFSNTDEFEIKVAVENNKHAQETYKKNHNQVEIFGDIKDVPFEKFEEKYGKIDVVIGGPPCQGFSNANRQKNHLISHNNKLVKDYVRAVEILNPNIFVMENVGMLKSETHRFYCEFGEKSKLKQLKITTMHHKMKLISNMIDPALQNKIRNKTINIESNLLDDNSYHFINALYKLINDPIKFAIKSSKYTKKYNKFKEIIFHRDNVDLNIMSRWILVSEQLEKYYKDNLVTDQIKNMLTEVVIIQKMLITLKELYENEIKYDIELDALNDLYIHIDSYSIWDYIYFTLSQPSNGYSIKADILNAADFGAPQKRNRFIAIGVKKKVLGTHELSLPQGEFSKTKNYRTVYNAIGDLENYTPDEDKGSDPQNYKQKRANYLNPLSGLQNSKKLYNHIITSSRDAAVERFKILKQGQNFHNLSEELKNNTYSDYTRTQNTIYLKLKYDEPSNTVLNVRKSMWIHPVLPRALSVREAARLQTFPDSFIFTGTKDSQYQQVGNAVPPMLSEAIARHLLDILKSKK